jgi:hypothetical protein
MTKAPSPPAPIWPASSGRESVFPSRVSESSSQLGAGVTVWIRTACATPSPVLVNRTLVSVTWAPARVPMSRMFALVTIRGAPFGAGGRAAVREVWRIRKPGGA